MPSAGKSHPNMESNIFSQILKRRMDINGRSSFQRNMGCTDRIIVDVNFQLRNKTKDNIMYKCSNLILKNDDKTVKFHVDINTLLW